MATTNNGTAASAPVFRFSATYKSPTNEPFTFSESLTAPPTSGAGDKAAYLNALRNSINAAQDNINRELTARMEEDKANDAAKSAVDDAFEEENYGEEAPPNDD
ncbi:Putative EKC/KEOPS complex, subunit Gon7 protein [Colletotrichum destructivum]|uniref:EKC/KEOPS complex subunit GON7 n=1 Tax=Colletotrichum destructivum TaxID=34406 RepID=A0AAX4IDR9_9PEZI|nr:Putative EKC/KEOPS complex, subunit Gon7 protein [Colletotrichum destructivum]